MKIRTENEIREFNEALDRCTSPVWLMGPNDEYYNLKAADEYARGMSRLMGTDNDQLGIFTSSYTDEAVMVGICQKLAA